MDDDADRGARGLRARPRPALLQAVREHWGLGRTAGAVDLGGSSSLNLLLDTDQGRYVARAHRPHLTPERLAAIHQARAALRAGGVPCAPPVPTLEGAPWISLHGRLVELEPYVDHDAKMDTWERLATGMPVLARAHNLLGRLEAGEAGSRPRFANHLEPAEVSSAVRRGTGRIRAWGPTAAELRVAAVAEELAELVTEAEVEAGLGSRLPRQLVHGDFWDNNVLFRRGRPVLVADFDFMGDGPASTTWP